MKDLLVLTTDLETIKTTLNHELYWIAPEPTHLWVAFNRDWDGFWETIRDLALAGF